MASRPETSSIGSDSNHSFQSISAVTNGNFNLATKGAPEQVNGRRVTPGFFNMMGYPLMMGRDFLPEEGTPGNDHVVMLTHKLWLRLGANPNIVGQQMRINSEPYTVVGVLGRRAYRIAMTPKLTTPLAFRPEQINHDYHWMIAMGRLKPGVSIQQAQADMDAVLPNASPPPTPKAIVDGAHGSIASRTTFSPMTAFKPSGCCWER